MWSDGVQESNERTVVRGGPPACPVDHRRAEVVAAPTLERLLSRHGIEIAVGVVDPLGLFRQSRGFPQGELRAKAAGLMGMKGAGGRPSSAAGPPAGDGASNSRCRPSTRGNEAPMMVCLSRRGRREVEV